MRGWTWAFVLLLAGPWVNVGWSEHGDRASAADEVAPADAPSSTGRPVYLDVTRAAGLGGFRHAGYLGPGELQGPAVHFPEAMGPGACWLDHDADGLLDVYLVNGLHLGRPERNAIQDPHSQLFRNNGDGTFTDVTDTTGTRIVAVSMGCAAADYDNDGLTDLIVTSWGGARLLHNVGGAFEDVSEEAGIRFEQCGDVLCWTTGASWFDSDLDGCLDLFLDHFTNYDPDKPGNPFGGLGNPQRNKFFRGDCHGTFEDVTAEAGLADEAHNTWSSLAADFDQDGWPDLLACNDGNPVDLYHNDRDGTFTRAKDGPENEARACMGSAIGDPNHDGRWDLAFTNYMAEHNGIYIADGDGYVDIGGDEPFTDAWDWIGWGDHWYDINNDGHQDLMLVNSNTQNDIWPDEQPVLAYENRGDGTFISVRENLGEGVTRDYLGRGTAWADYDDDGDLDLLLAEGGEEGTNLLRADLTGGNFLNVDLVATAPDVNRDAIGAHITVNAPGLPPQHHEKLAGSGYMGSNDPRFHFGLGRAESADVEVRWPDGSTGSWQDLPGNSFVRLTQGDPEPQLLRTLPVLRVSGTDTARRFEPVTFAAAMAPTEGAAAASLVWDLGDGTPRGAGATFTASFGDVGGFHARATVTDTLDRTKSQGFGVLVWDELAAEVDVRVPELAVGEKVTGEVLVRFSNGDPVRAANVLVTVTHSTGSPLADDALAAAGGLHEDITGPEPFVFHGSTDANGRVSFDVPFNLIIDVDSPDADPVEGNLPGTYHVRVEGGARGSVFEPVETEYVVLAAVPDRPRSM